MFDLSGYKPEAVKDNDFEMMKGKGHICKVNSSIIEDVEAGNRDGEPYEAYTRLKYELEVISEKYRTRRAWKSINLDSEMRTGKAQKTPTEKLADIFFTVGLEFGDRASLEAANERFAEMNLMVSFSKWTPPGKDELQLHTVTGIAPEQWEEETVPTVVTSQATF